MLKSWAVPKGISMEPGVKRLAMEVEDHPLEYAHFEGTIPEGNYGAGEVRIWDEGFYHSSQTASMDPADNVRALRDGLAKGHLDFLLYGTKLKGHFSLIKIKSPQKGRNAWLLIKHKDDFAHEESRSEGNSMPKNVHPMLARLKTEPFDGSDWIFEVKWDGYRAIAEIEDGKVALYSRNGLSFAQKFPSIVEALSHIKQNMVLDGEIVAVVDGRPNFHALQNFGEVPAHLQYVVFDILYAEGKDLRQKPLWERKDILKSILPHHSLLVYNDHVENDGVAYFNELKKLGMEGMVAKRADSPYREGTRNGDWIKLKIKKDQEAIICGFTAPRGARKKLGALILGAYDKGKLTYVGHSGGGFTEKEIDSLHERLVKAQISESPFEETVRADMPITWVKPEFVCAIDFSEWTPDGRMRHPIFKGLRMDKDPKEVVKEQIGESRDEGEKTASSPQPSPSKKERESETLDRFRSIPDNTPWKSPKFTNRDKVFWPEQGYTKGDLIDYYDSIASYILPHLKDRPESLNRHPDGIDGKNFFHKDMTTPVPDFAETRDVYSESNEKPIRYLLCQNKETLLYLANLGCIEINPWLSRVDNLENPDFVIIDLDPGKAPFKELVHTARKVREILEEAGVKSVCKTSGKSGLHIMAPMGGNYSYDQARIFSELVARLTHRELPEITSVDRVPSRRGDKVYVDYLQNRKGQTVAAPYSLRPCPGATVSTPLDWNEVSEELNPKAFTIKTTLSRLEKTGDLWRPALGAGVDISKVLKVLEDRRIPDGKYREDQRLLF